MENDNIKAVPLSGVLGVTGCGVLGPRRSTTQEFGTWPESLVLRVKRITWKQPRGFRLGEVATLSKMPMRFKV